MKCSGNVSSGTIINVSGGWVNIPGEQPVMVTDAQITIDASIVTPAYTWNGHSWNINVPMSDAKNNIFFSGVILNSIGLPCGLNPVDFTATFTADHAGVDAAGTHAGVPNSYNGHAVGGARGAADLTGSWSATDHVVTCVG